MSCIYTYTPCRQYVDVANLLDPQDLHALQGLLLLRHQSILILFIILLELNSPHHPHPLYCSSSSSSSADDNAPHLKC